MKSNTTDLLLGVRVKTLSYRYVKAGSRISGSTHPDVMLLFKHLT